MTKNEWQKHHGISDEKMAIIELGLMIFGSKNKPANVVSFWDTRIMGRWGDGKNVLSLDVTK